MKLNLSADAARKILVGLWFIFFFLNLAVIFYLYFDRWIEGDNFKAAVYQVNSSYVTYLGLMGAYYFSNRKRVPRQRPGMAFVLALAGSAIWNIIIFAFVFRVFLLLGPIEDAIQQISYFSSLLSWLVAPAIGLYFANQSLQQAKGAG